MAALQGTCITTPTADAPHEQITHISAAATGTWPSRPPDAVRL